MTIRNNAICLRKMVLFTIPLNGAGRENKIAVNLFQAIGLKIRIKHRHKILRHVREKMTRKKAMLPLVEEITSEIRFAFPFLPLPLGGRCCVAHIAKLLKKI